MAQSDNASLKIDLDQFKLHLYTRGTGKITLHFDTPSRRFYLSVIALVIEQMRKNGSNAAFAPLIDHAEILALLNETVGGGAGSSKEKWLLPRIYRKWKSALPDLENAPLFQVIGKSKDYGDASGKIYRFDDSVKDAWANLFEYRGNGEKVRLRFSVEKLGIGLEDVFIVYGEPLDAQEGRAWDRFVEKLREPPGDRQTTRLEHDENLKRPELMEESEETRRAKTEINPHDPMENQPTMVNQSPVDSSTSNPFIPTRSGDVIRASANFPFDQKDQIMGRHKRIVLMAISGLFLLAAIATLCKSYLRPSFPPNPTKPEMLVSPGNPSKASIAVLPFTNISGDPNEDYLSDGITEQIITALSKTPKVFIIARNSAFTYKNKPVKVQQVGKELGVRYVLEGSVQKSGDRLCITAQLIDAATGSHVWGESYDRDLKDIFVLQDDITRNVIMALQGVSDGGVRSSNFPVREIDSTPARLS